MDRAALSGLLGAVLLAAAGCKSPTRPAQDGPSAAEKGGLPELPIVAGAPLEGKVAELDALDLGPNELLFVEDGHLWRNFAASAPLARVPLEDLEGYDVYRGPDGDLWRRKVGYWRPSLRAQRRLSARPLPAWSGVAELANLPLYEIRDGERLAAWQSVPLLRPRAYAIWRAAMAHPVAGFTPVLFAEELRELPLAPAPRTAKASDVLAAQERRLAAEHHSNEEIAAMKRELAGLSDTALLPAPPDPFLYELTAGKPVLLLLQGEPCDVLPMLGFSAPNYDLESDQLAAVLCAWRAAYGAEIVYVGNHLEAVPGRTLSPIELRAVAWQQFVLDIDIVEQGTGTVAALARVLRKGHWYFWWD